MLSAGAVRWFVLLSATGVNCAAGTDTEVYNYKMDFRGKEQLT